MHTRLSCLDRPPASAQSPGITTRLQDRFHNDCGRFHHTEERPFWPLEGLDEKVASMWVFIVLALAAHVHTKGKSSAKDGDVLIMPTFRI